MAGESTLRKKRTTVRFYLPRAIVRTLSLLPPPTAERLVARKFAEPRRSSKASAPSIAGMTAHEFAMSSGPYRVVAWNWGKGPAVLLVHGWSGHGAQMMHFAPGLLARGFSVVAFDLPAHGQSSGRSCTLPDLAESILTLGNRFRPVAGIIAHSLGGAASALAISKGLSVDRAVLLAPPAEPKRYVRALATHLGLPKNRQDGAVREVEKMFSVNLDSFDLPKLASQFATPALIIHDEKDVEVPVESGKLIAKAWPGARLHLTNNLGHHRLLRDPKIVSMAINFFGEPQRYEAENPSQQRVALTGE